MFFSKSAIIIAPGLFGGPRVTLPEDCDDTPEKRRRFSSDNELESYPYPEESKSVFSNGDILV